MLRNNRSDLTGPSESDQELRERISRLEKELALERARTRSFAEQAPVGMMVVENSLVAYANSAWLQMFGYADSAEVIGTSPLDYIAPEALAHTVGLFRSARSADVTPHHSMESVGLKKDGATFLIHLNITESAWEEGQGYLAIIQNITERKEAEERLRQSEARYRAIFNNAAAGIAVVDKEGRYLDANGHYATLFGYSREEVLALDPLKLIHPENRDSTGQMLQQLLAGKIDYYAMQKRYLRKDGSSFYGSVFVSPILDDQGNIVSGVCLVLDITERVMAQDELAKMNRNLEALVRQRTMDLEEKALELEGANIKLRQIDELKTNFLSSVSHELRTPLTSIFGFAKLIRRDFGKRFLPLAEGEPDLAKRAKRVITNLEIIEHEGGRLSRLVNDVLDLSKIESGHYDWNDRFFSMEEVVYEAILAVRGLYAEKRLVKLSADIPKTLPQVRADPDRILQVLINLLTNAAKFTHKGKVDIVASTTDKGCVRVTVSDTGIGISTEDKERVFDKFQQARTADTLVKKPEGTGLGLTICRQIIEHYGGRIWVESELGRGSAFSFLLPKKANRPSAQKKSCAEAANPLGQS